MRHLPELELEAERRKRRFEDSYDDLRRHLGPRIFADEALRILDLPGRQAISSLSDAIRRNPLLTIGLAAGATWLIFTAHRNGRRAQRRDVLRHRKKEIAHAQGSS